MQPYLSRPPLQPTQRQAGHFNVPNATATGRHLYVPQRDGRLLSMHDFSGTPAHANQQFGHFADAAQMQHPHAPTYQPHNFSTPSAPRHLPHRQFPMGPFIVAVIIGVAIFSAWAGYHAISTPDPVNAAPPVVYSK